MKLNSIEEIKAYYQGKKDGIWLFAWWKEGEQYVGTSGRKYKDIIKEEDKIESEMINSFKQNISIYTG